MALRSSIHREGTVIHPLYGLYDSAWSTASIIMDVWGRTTWSSHSHEEMFHMQCCETCKADIPLQYGAGRFQTGTTFFSEMKNVAFENVPCRYCQIGTLWTPSPIRKYAFLSVFHRICRFFENDQTIFQT